MPTKKNKPHYIAMSGYHGCLPDHLACFKKYSEAVRDLIDVFQLPRDGVKATELRKCGYVELDEADWPGRNEHRYGAEYAEIQKCNCDHPKIHDEDFQEG
jgi:CO dehydrogenase/acetyl-CoA synthase delta subunit